MMNVRAAKALIGCAMILATAGLVRTGQGVDRAEPQPAVAGADRIVAGLEATAARETRQIASFTTTKTFTIEHDGETRAQIVAALRFTAPDVKAFAVTANRGSDFLRGRVIEKMMAAEIEAARRSRSASVAISSANYQFGALGQDGDAFVIEALPRRQDDLLFKGRIWITTEGFHLKRIEGEPARNPSFWTRRIHFVTEYAPVNGVWLQVRTVADVTVRWFGEYVVRSECGPYELALLPEIARSSPDRH